MGAGWLTSGDAEQPIVLYDYQSNRKAKQFLEDSLVGSMQTATRAISGCHVRYKFDEALIVVPKELQSASKPAEALCYFSKLFQMEQDFAVLTAEERFAKRLEQG